MHRELIVCITLIATAVGLVACSSPTIASSATSATSSQAPAGSYQGGQTLHVSAPIKVVSGYQYMINADVKWGKPTTSILEAAPGTTDVLVPGTISATIFNKTPGREAPLATLAHIEIKLVYPSDSIFCAGGTGLDDADTFCAITVGLGNIGDIASTTMPAPLGASMQQSYDFTYEGKMPDPLIQFTPSEAHVPDVIAALQVPPTAIAILSDDPYDQLPDLGCSYDFTGNKIAWLSNDSAVAQAMCKLPPSQ